jgi:hypothetical protein
VSLLLLDPLFLLLYAAVAAYGWVVWSGRFRAWFRPDRLWLGFWPLPVVVAVVPLLVGPLLRGLDGLGPRGEAGGLLAVTAYVVANGVPMAWLGLAPPRWLLPPWARARLARLDVPGELPAPDAVAALHVHRTRATVSWPRWRWRIDAEPGHVWVDGGHLRFRATGAGDGDTTVGIGEFDQAEIDQLELRWGDEARLEPPRGGWWRRRQLDVELDAVDDVRVGARRPWADDGLVTLRVEGRPPLRLWVARMRDVRNAIELAAEGTG